MAVALREIPEIARTEIDHFELALGVNHRHLAVAINDVGPFGGIVPMHFARSARVDEQMRASNVGREWKSPCRHLAPSRRT